jgi:hypothetical protein
MMNATKGHWHKMSINIRFFRLDSFMFLFCVSICSYEIIVFLLIQEDDAPVIMDVKDGNDVYALMKAARQFRMPGMGSVMAKQDEGAKATGALPE